MLRYSNQSNQTFRQRKIKEVTNTNIISLKINNTTYHLTQTEAHKFICNRCDDPKSAKHRKTNPSEQRPRWGIYGTACTCFLKIDIFEAYTDKKLTKNTNKKYCIVSDSLISIPNHDISILYATIFCCLYISYLKNLILI